MEDSEVTDVISGIKEVDAPECQEPENIQVTGREDDQTVVGYGGDRGKRPMMAKFATDKSDICILTSDNPRTEDPLDI